MKIDLFKLLPKGKKNRKGDHWVSDCPFCDKEQHFYINIEKIFQKSDLGLYKNAFDCKQCGTVGNIVILLEKLGKLELLQGEPIDLKKKLERKIGIIKEEKEEEEIEELPNRKLPLGFKRIYSDEYLKERGLLERDFEKDIIGKTELVSALADYVIIAVIENGNIKGYIARSRLSKEEIKEINNEYKRQGSKRRYLRWVNSKGTDFSKLLFGIDEVGFQTKSVIIVEGYNDKKAVDKTLGLDYNFEVKCLCSFGKSLSTYQIKKLKNKGNVENIILIQDPDAVKESKRHSMELKKHFNVSVGFTGNKDLGASNAEEILSVFDNLKKPLQYSLSTVLKRELK